MFANILPRQARLSTSIYKSVAVRSVLSSKHGFSATVLSRNFSKIYIENVPRLAKKAELTNIFAKFGTVKKTTIGTTRGSGFACVFFEKPEDADKAIMSSKTHPIQLENLTLNVKVANPSSRSKEALVVYGLDNFEEKEVRNLFDGFRVTDIRLKPARPSVTFVDFKNATTATEALKAVEPLGKGFEFKENKIQGGNVKDTLVAEGLDTSDKNEVRALFNGFDIVNVRIFPPRNIAVVVKFDSPEAAAEAFAKARKMKKGSTINIEYARL